MAKFSTYVTLPPQKVIRHASLNANVCAVVQLDPVAPDSVITEQAGTVLLFNIAKIVSTQLTITINVEYASATAQFGE